MKKFLSLVLALVMTMSLVTVSAGAKDYADADKITYVEAVDVLSALGVLEGDATGFRPTDTLKRSEAAKIICALNLTPKTAATLSADTAPFADVAVSHWAAGYIAEGVQSGILAGVGNNCFNPDGELTGYAYLKMLLVCLGYDAAIEGMTGPNWSVNVAKLAKAAGLTKGNDNFVGTKAVTREEAALYALNALKAETVSYANKGTSIYVNGMEIATGASAAVKTGEKYLSENYKKLKEYSEVDAYGRPATQWIYKGDEIGTYAETPVLTYTAKTDADDIADDLKAEGYKKYLGKSDKAYAIDDETYAGLTANGTVVEFFGKTVEIDEKDVDVIYDVVTIETFAAKVGTITKDKAKTEDDERAIVIEGYGKIVADKDVTKGVEVDNFDELYDELEKGDIVLVTLNTKKDIATVEIPETVEGKVTRNSDSKIVVDGETIEKSAHDVGTYTVKSKVTVYLDAYGYAISSGDVKAEESEVVYLTYTFKSEDKYGDATWYAQIVTAEGETEELVLDADAKNFDDVKKAEARGQLYTYTTNDDDEITLTAAKDVVALTEGGELKVASYVKVDGKKYYYDDDVTMVYVDGKGSKLDVTVADELKKVAEIPANSWLVLNDDDDVVVVFIGDEASTVVDSDDVIYVADTTKVADDAEGAVIKAYIDGEKEEIVVKAIPASAGFYTYSVNDDDVYTLKAVKASTISTVTDTYKDKWMTIAADEDTDYVLADDATVIDLTDNDIADVADLAAAIEDGEKIVATVIFDDDDEVVTFMVITKA